MKRGDKRLILYNELVVRTLVWPVPMPDNNSLLYLFTTSYSCPFIVCCCVPFSVFVPSILWVGSRQREEHDALANSILTQSFEYQETRIWKDPRLKLKI